MDNLKSVFIVLSFSFLLLNSCSEDPTESVDLSLNQKLQKALDDGVVKYGGIGISAALIMPDGETWSGAGGTSDGTVPVNTDMLFSAGSITKMFTAMTILQLAEEGILSLEDSIHQWLPSYSNIDSTITIRQLLNHTNGIFNITENPDIWTHIFADPDKEWTMDEAVGGYTLEPYFPKGTSWHYSNTGYLLLRMLIKEATGSDIASEYRTRLFDPLGMDNTYLAPFESMTDPMVQPWLDLDGNGTYDQLPFMTSFYSMAGGGIFCTPRDLAKWSHAVFVEKNLLSQSYHDQMMVFHSPCPDEELVNGYGLGVCNFNQDLFNGHIVWGHGGDALGYAAACLYLPDYGVCLAFMDNTEEGETMWVINDLLDIIIQHLDG